MRLSKREFIQHMALLAAGSMITGGVARADGDLIEGWLSGVKIFEFALDKSRVRSLSDRQSPIWSNELTKLVNGFLKIEITKYPNLNKIVIRDPLPVKPWTSGVLQFGVSVSVQKVDDETYVAAFYSIYKRVYRTNFENYPPRSSDFRKTVDTTYPVGFLINKGNAEDPLKLGGILFENYKLKLKDDLKRISEIKKITNE
jgi:hypothetical protein